MLVYALLACTLVSALCLFLAIAALIVGRSEDD